MTYGTAATDATQAAPDRGEPLTPDPHGLEAANGPPELIRDGEQADGPPVDPVPLPRGIVTPEDLPDVMGHRNGPYPESITRIASPALGGAIVVPVYHGEVHAPRADRGTTRVAPASRRQHPVR